MGSTMDFRLLGPVEALIDGKSVSISAPRQKTVLALLLAECGKVVSVERMMDALWPEGPPPTARSQIQITVSALRRMIGGDVILTRSPGYLIEVPAETIDLNRFEGLAADAATAAEEGQLDYAVRLLRSALAIWSGRAMEGLRGDVTSAIAARINERRMYIIQKRIKFELQLGRHCELVAELREYVAGDSLNEGLRGLLALALYRAGRQSDALHVLREGRELLADEMGLDPGGELRRLEHAILTADPSLDLAEAPRPRETADAVPVRKAPARYEGGRLDELSAFDLLTRLVGRHRVNAEPEAVHDLIALCDGVPLALCAAGEELAAGPHLLLSQVVARLKDRRGLTQPE